MKNTSKHLFLSSKNGNDLLVAINQRISENNLEQQTPTPVITEARFYYLVYRCKNRFKSYNLPKKRGGLREITTPIVEYKVILRVLKEIIEEIFQVGPLVHGFVEGRSIVSNAKKHVGRKFILNVDLLNFFPSIHFGRVSSVFRLSPFNFAKNQADLIAHICCYNKILPQGSPVSPIISNLVCQRLDRKIARLSASKKAQATRYCDDITFSSNHQIFDTKFNSELKSIINSEGFELNPSKTRILSSKQRQEVTGIIVNKKMNISSQKKNEIRWLINLWKKRGIVVAQDWLNKNYKYRSRYGGEVPDLAKVLEGNLNFMKMVTGENRSSYKRLLLKYQELLSLDQENSTDITSLEKELKILLERFESTDGEAKFLAASKFIVFQNFYAKNKNAERFVKTLSERLDFYIKNDEYMHSQEKIKQQAQNFLRPPLDNELLGEAKKTSKGRWRDGKAPNINDNLEALNLFRDTSKDLGYVFHNNEEKTYDVILKDSLIYVNAHINNIGGNLSFNIKKETYEIISLLFRKLRNRLERGLFNSIYFDDVIQDKNYANILNSFKKLTRFGIMHHQTRISDTICDAIIEAKLDESNFPLIRIQNNIDSLFQDILAPIHTVHDGIVKILTIIKQHTTGKGSINIVAREWNNKIVLRITNMNSFPQQEIKDLVQGLDRGDINSLSNTLLGICELNIITNPNNKGYYRIGILPSQSESKHDVDRYNPSGTTYELIFHRTYRVLILDDSGNGERIQQLEDNYNLNNKNSIQVSFKTKVESTDDLAGFNIACVHRSQQEGLSFAKILNFFKSENTPLILIGGGCELREENKKLISVPYTIFSEKINAFYEITARLKPQKLSKLMLMFSSHCNDSNNEKDTLIKKIQTKSITIPLSDTSLIEEVKKITNLSSLPNFKSKEELIQLIKFI